MDLNISQLCASCGKPVDWESETLPLCSECRQRGLTPSHWEQPSPSPSPSPRPPWNLSAALTVLLFFMLAMWFIPAFAIGIWAELKGLSITPTNVEQLMRNPQANLVGIISVFGVHVLTLFIAWTVVTGWERRFTEVIDWSWHRRFRFSHALITVALLYATTWILDFFLEGAETDFDKLLRTSQAVRIAVSVLAVVSAPFVEELVYRGIIYPAVEARFGRLIAILTVGGVFALVHFPQYWGSMLILVSLTILSFVLTAIRAYTGKLLPCYIVHLLYNLVGVTLILTGYGLTV